MTNQIGNEDILESSVYSSKLVAIVAIIAATLIILACNATAIVYIYNVPW